ncbi:WSC-domain-containing protein [Tuber magnatum]|uniref:WSC-domain-containing protein n=1 Tax=Tuber magnatum TaxID=42249 RepID=A0A317SVA0_9PEZI|nr:WSC-domain-containing protein [Tuber magnatum]
MFGRTPFVTGSVAAVLALAILVPQAAAFWRLPCLNKLLVERNDPIVNPGAVSGHLHTIMGGNGFNFTMDYQVARASTCSSCTVKQDLSNYWIPNVFYQAKNGSFFPVEQIGGATIYYLQRRDPPEEKLKAFPPGFRMVTGDPWLRHNNTVVGKTDAFTYICLDYSGGSRGMKERYTEFPDRNCPSGLRVQIFFPSCWNGKDLDSPDHKSHMAYPTNVNFGKCPPSHPVRFISVFYEIIFNTNAFKDQWYDNKQPFLLSNGDPTGYSLHGDFINGWDVDVLQKAIDTCNSASGAVEECSVFKFFERERSQDCMVPPRVEEQTTGWLDKLPGCNPVQPGPERAIQYTNCGAQEKIGAPTKYYTDVSAKNWEYVGCVLDNLTSRTFPEREDFNDLTVEKCIDYCVSKGFEWAGMEYGRECYCGKSAPPQDRMGYSRCTTPCAGDDKQYCGAAQRLSTYKAKGPGSNTFGTP